MKKQIKKLIKESNEMIVSKARGESWKDADARNEYYEEEGFRKGIKKAEQLIDNFGGWLILNYESKTKEGIINKVSELSAELRRSAK